MLPHLPFIILKNIMQNKDDIIEKMCNKFGIKPSDRVVTPGYGYSECISLVPGVKFLWAVRAGDYQGTYIAKIQIGEDQEPKYISTWYGSCSSTDAYQAEFEDYREDIDGITEKQIAFGKGYVDDARIWLDLTPVICVTFTILKTSSMYLERPLRLLSKFKHLSRIKSYQRTHVGSLVAFIF